MNEIYEFGFPKIERDDFVSTFTEKIITQVINAENEAIREAFINYARKYADEKEEKVKLILLDEHCVRQILDLGINAYMRLYSSEEVNK